MDPVWLSLSHLRIPQPCCSFRVLHHNRMSQDLAYVLVAHGHAQRGNTHTEQLYLWRTNAVARALVTKGKGGEGELLKTKQTNNKKNGEANSVKPTCTVPFFLGRFSWLSFFFFFFSIEVCYKACLPHPALPFTLLEQSGMLIDWELHATAAALLMKHTSTQSYLGNLLWD